MPTEALDLDTNVYADWCIELVSNDNTTKPSKGTLRYFQNVAVNFACVGVKRHKGHVEAEDVRGGEVLQRLCCRRFPSVVGGEIPWKDAGMTDKGNQFLEKYVRNAEAPPESLAALEA